MCKAAHERGGPYRCPGDMQKKVAVAVDEFSNATDAQREAAQAVLRKRDTLTLANANHDTALKIQMRRRGDHDAPWSVNGVVAPAREHIERLIGSGDLPHSARDLTATEAFDHYARTKGIEPDDPGMPEHDGASDPQFKQAIGMSQRTFTHLEMARTSLGTAEDRYRSAALRTKHAQKSLEEARADYHSTARGLGELQRDHDTEFTHGDPIASARLNTLVIRARTRADQEAHRRYEGALERGEDPTPYAYSMAPMRTQDDESDGSGTVWLARRDRISGSARVYDQQVNTSPTSVTLTRNDRGEVHEATFDVPAGQPPSVGTLLGALASTKDSVDRTGTFDGWRAENGFVDTDEDRSRARFAYNSARANARRFERFLGADRAREYVDVHRHGKSPALVAV